MSLTRILALLSLVVGASSACAQTPKKIEYNRDIRPILAENCFNCHGPDSASRKAGLRVDRREDALKSEAFVPGKADESELIRRVFSTQAGEQMPPAKTNKKLTAEQKETLKAWINQGAEYQQHWSFIAPKRPAVPAVKNKAWVRNPIDAFILKDVEGLGLTPAPEADRRTLARRLSLDIVGLPPSPADVEAFVNDKSPDYYERFIDKMMQSPHYGEHRARYWLDAARYADTHGIHFDNFREMHAYRDWVIDAFQKNMKFDQFTIEQLAGDLLPKPTLDQRVATGFNRCNITTNEGGVIAEEYLVLYTRDRIETTAMTWMGLNVNCSVCHDHKFDPISQREFYEMAAFFNNTTQGAMDGNIKDTPPVLFVPRREDRAAWDGLTGKLADVRKQIEARKTKARPEFDKWLSSSTPEQHLAQIPTEKLIFRAPLNEGKGEKTKFIVAGQDREIKLASASWDKGVIDEQAYKTKAGNDIALADVGDFEKDQPFTVSAWIKIPRNVPTGAILARMDSGNNFRGWDLWLENNRIGMHIINKWDDNAIKVVAQQAVGFDKWYHVAVTYDGSAKAAGLHIFIDGVRADARTVFKDQLKSTIKTAVPFKIGQRDKDSPIVGMNLQDVRIYQKALTNDEVSRLTKGSRAAFLAAKPAEKRTIQETEDLFNWWIAAHDAESQTLSKSLSSLTQEEASIKARGTLAHVMNEKKEEPIAFILHRGDYDKRRDQVKAVTPKALPPMPEDLPRNRLGFAKWLLREEHPLTARVTVNRFWQELFGNGLVRTAGDFGIAGELPSHPELLDWLAIEFRESGWDVQKLFKLMLTSATYRQASATTKEHLVKDPQNRFLSRGPRFRMDAEMIRDYALSTSGLLVPKIGGPSVKPYQPEGVWEAVAMMESNTRYYKVDKGEALYRRSMYTFWKRAAPPAAMDILNSPNREFCTVKRDRTNTPLHALVTMNDVQFVEAARNLAQKTLKEGGDTDASRLDFIARRVLCRPLRDAEIKIVEKSLNRFVEHYTNNADEARKLIAVGESRADAALDAPRLAAWTMLANQLLNLDEVLNR